MTNKDNRFLVNSIARFSLSNASHKFSNRFTIQNSKTCSKVRFYLYALYGTSPTYRVGLQADNGGEPSGNFLAYGDIQPSSTGWKEVTLGSSIALTKGNVYHLVIQYQSGIIDGSNYIKIIYNEPNNNMIPFDCRIDNQQAVYYNYGAGWQDLTASPIYVIVFTDNTYEGNPYTQESSTIAYGVNWKSEKYKAYESFVVSKISFRVKKNASTDPSDDLYYEVRDSNENVLRSGTIVTKTTVTTSYVWYEAVLSSKLRLDKNKTYRFVLKSPNSNSSYYYNIQMCYVIDSSVYINLGYQGSDCTHSSSGNSGASFFDYTNKDLSFKLTIETIKGAFPTFLPGT